VGRWRNLGYNFGMSNPAELIAHGFVRPINRQEVASLVALMAPEHRLVNSLGNAVHGRKKMRSGWAGYLGMVPDYSIAIEETLSDGPVVVLTGVAKGTLAPKGELKTENRRKILVAIQAQIEEGLVTEWRVYADNEPLREKMRSSPQDAA